MRVMELAMRTGVSSRSIRHYGRAGLLTSWRLSNGYRHFEEAAVAEVASLRSLLAAGLSLNDIITIRPCLSAAGAIAPCDLARRVLTGHITRLRDRIAADSETLEILQDRVIDMR